MIAAVRFERMNAAALTRRLAELVGWGATAGVGCVMLTQAVGWDGSRHVASLQSMTPYGIPLIVLVTALAMWAKSHALAVGATIVGLSTMGLSIPVVFPGGQPPPDGTAIGLRAASVNLLYRNPSVDDVATDLQARDIDLIVFSEFTPEHKITLVDQQLDEAFPYQINREGGLAGGMAVWSKYPITEYPITEQPRLDTVNRTIDATVDGPDGEIRIFAVHPPTPIYSFDQWVRELDEIGDVADSVTEPTLVIGDFNASFWHPSFRDLLGRGLTDAHLSLGHGWSTSWPNGRKIPRFVRLDHALTGNGLVSTAVEDFHVTGSDHAAFIVTVKPAAG